MVPQFPQLSETFIVNKVLGLVDRGVDVQVVCGPTPDANWQAFGDGHRVGELVDRVHVAPRLGRSLTALRSACSGAVDLLSNNRSDARRYLGDDAESLTRRLRDLAVDAPLIQLDPDVVHFEFGALAPARMKIRDRLGVAVTVSFRGYDINYAGLNDPHFYDPVWAGADGIHVLGEDLWNRAIHRGAPPDLPHTRITPAIDSSIVDPTPVRLGVLGDAVNPLRVLSVGRLHWKKGYEYALEAIAALRADGLNVEYRIVGDGELLGAVAFWRHQLGLDEGVELLRSVPPAEVARQLAWADVFLHSATSEGFCNAVIEAQAHGVPVVSSDADGLGENVEGDVTGFVVPRRDAGALADHLLRLARDPELRYRIGAAGPDRVASQFAFDDHVDAWVSFYDDALARRHGANPQRGSTSEVTVDPQR